MRSALALALAAFLTCAACSHAEQREKDEPKAENEIEVGGASVVMLETPEGWTGFASSISADGSTIIGYAIRDTDGDGLAESAIPLKWDASGAYERLPVYENARAFRASRATEKGGLILGYDDAKGHAVSWLRDGRATPLLAGSNNVQIVSGVSGDGTLLVGTDDESFESPYKVFPIEYTLDGLVLRDAIELEEGARPSRISNGMILGLLLGPRGGFRAAAWDASGRRVATFDAIAISHASLQDARGSRSYVATRFGPVAPGNRDRAVDIVILGLGDEPFVVHAGASSRDEYNFRGATDDHELLFGEIWPGRRDSSRGVPVREREEPTGWVWTPDLGMVSCDEAFDAWGIDTGGASVERIVGMSADGRTLVGTIIQEGKTAADYTLPFVVRLDD